MSASRRARESGIATVLAVGWILVLALVFVALAQVAVVVWADRRAAGASDLAALSASRAAVDGQPACRHAAAIAKANGARLTSCRMDLAVATVEVSTTARGPLGRWTLTSSARAAPADYVLE